MAAQVTAQGHEGADEGEDDVDVLNYKLVPGQRAGSFLVLFNGKLFSKDKEARGRVHYRCRRFKTCPVTGVLANGVFTLIKDLPHTCLDNETTADVLTITSDMKEKAVKAGSKDLIGIFNEVLAAAPPTAAATVSYQAAKMSMRRARRKLYPKNVRTPQEVTEHMEKRESPITDFYYKTLIVRYAGKDERMVMLYHPPLVEKVNADVTSYLFDATFKTCPIGFYQVLNVAAEIHGQICLLFSVLMTRKAKPLYVAVLKELKEAFPQIDPKFATADFESGLMKAIEEIYPECDTTGCQFHSGHAINKKMKSPEIALYRWVKTNPSCNMLYRKYLSLSFIPAREMVKRLRDLREEIDSTVPVNARQKFRKFHLYIKAYWIRKVRPERLSVFGKPRRTNNGLENLHGQMSRTLVKHGNVFKFVLGLKKNIWTPCMVRLMAIEQGNYVQPPQRPKQLLREEKITNLQGKYLRKQLTLKQYHEEISGMFHSYEPKKPGAAEAQFLTRDVEDEFTFSDPPVRRRLPIDPDQSGDPDFVPPPDLDDEGEETDDVLMPPRREDLLEDDDEGFEPVEGWPELALSDDDNLSEPDHEDTVDEQARAVDRHMNQLVPMCPICLTEMKNPHITNCGHRACLVCFIQAGCDVRNVEPLPRCPLCRSGVKHLVPVYECQMVPRHELIDRTQQDVANAEHDLNPADLLTQEAVFGEQEQVDGAPLRTQGSQGSQPRPATVLSRRRNLSQEDATERRNPPPAASRQPQARPIVVVDLVVEGEEGEEAFRDPMPGPSGLQRAGVQNPRPGPSRQAVGNLSTSMFYRAAATEDEDEDETPPPVRPRRRGRGPGKKRTTASQPTGGRGNRRRGIDEDYQPPPQASSQPAPARRPPGRPSKPRPTATATAATAPAPAPNAAAPTEEYLTREERRTLFEDAFEGF